MKDYRVQLLLVLFPARLPARVRSLSLAFPCDLHLTNVVACSSFVTDAIFSQAKKKRQAKDFTDLWEKDGKFLAKLPGVGGSTYTTFGDAKRLAEDFFSLETLQSKFVKKPFGAGIPVVIFGDSEIWYLGHHLRRVRNPGQTKANHIQFYDVL